MFYIRLQKLRKRSEIFLSIVMQNKWKFLNNQEGNKDFPQEIDVYQIKNVLDSALSQRNVG